MVDVAVVLSTAKEAERRVGSVSMTARSVLIPSLHTDARWTFQPPAGATALVLGPGSGLWTPRFRAGIKTPAFRRRNERPCFVLTQGCALAEQAVEAASLRGANLVAALSTGRVPDVVLQRIALSAAALEPQPLLLLGFHLSVSLSLLMQIAGSGCPTAILLAGGAKKLSDLPLPGRVLPPGADAVSRALGYPVVGSPEELMEVAFLTEKGITPRSGRVLAMASSPDEASLMDDALRARGLADRTTLLDDTTRASHLMKAEPFDCLLLGPRSRRKIRTEKIPALRYHPSASPRSDTIQDSSLAALAALLRRKQEGSAGRADRPRARTDHARALLDRWPASLHEIQVKRLLACYGLTSPAEGLVATSSAAGRIAREVGLPVVVKAVGPALFDRASKGVIRIDVPSASACRQAFRDVLFACSKLRPTPVLEGVLVSAMVDLPSALDCTLFWPDEAPALLLIRVRTGTFSHPDQLAYGCPLSLAMANRAAADIARTLTGTASTAAWREQLARFLHRLSWIGPELYGRLRCIQLDTVSLPWGKKPPLILDARAEQIEGS